METGVAGRLTFFDFPKIYAPDYTKKTSRFAAACFVAVLFYRISDNVLKVPSSIAS